MRNKKLGIFEPLYTNGQTLFESAFQPLILNNNDHAEWREFRILLNFFHEKKYEKYDYAGIMSPKFNLKTKITGKDFINFINASSEADVYIINAFPPLSYIAYNVWMHGEAFHPGITKRAQDLLDACEIKINLSNLPRQTNSILCYSNFWVGSAKFWSLYAKKILVPIEQYLLNNPDSDISKNVLEGTTHTDPAPFLPFIIERLFSTFLSVRDDVKVVAYPLDFNKSKAYCLNDFEMEIVNSMGETIDKEDSGNDYPTLLKESQNLHTRLYKLYFSEYYSRHPHPHTGHLADLFKK